MSKDITAEDRERITLLQLISSSKNEIKKLSLEQLKRLQELVEKKDYSHDKKPINQKLNYWPKSISEFMS